MKVAGFFEYNPYLDNHLESASLLSQMIWYFIDGFYNRLEEENIIKDSTVYYVSMQDGIYELKFYKGNKTGRWWLEVPCPQGKENLYGAVSTIPCSQKDYEKACQDEIPEKFIFTMKKFI